MDIKKGVQGEKQTNYVGNSISENIHLDNKKYFRIYITDEPSPSFNKPVRSYSLYKVVDSIAINQKLYKIENMGIDESYLTLKYEGIDNNWGITIGRTAKNFIS